MGFNGKLRSRGFSKPCLIDLVQCLLRTGLGWSQLQLHLTFQVEFISAALIERERYEDSIMGKYENQFIAVACSSHKTALP